jgi:ribosomal protein L7/L12
MLDATAFAQAVTDAEAEFKRTGRIDDALVTLRQAGCSIIDSIKAVKKITGVEIYTAKSVVHHSATYADQRARNDAFHRALADEFGLDPSAVVVPPPPADWMADSSTPRPGGLSGA